MSLFLRPDEVTDLNGRWHGIRLNEEYYAFFGCHVIWLHSTLPPATQEDYNSAQREERISERERYNVKKVSDFPSPAEMSLTKLSLAGNIVRESLVSDIPAGDRKIANIFLQCRTKGT